MISNMKSTMVIIFLLLFTVALFSGINKVTFGEFLDKDWSLIEVKRGSTIITIDRTNAPSKIYTIRFEERILSGTGAPNHYRAPYITTGNNIISIGRISCTRLGPLYELKGFKEYEFFRYLERVMSWDFRNGRLELRTSDENGDEVLLLFSPRGKYHAIF